MPGGLGRAQPTETATQVITDWDRPELPNQGSRRRESGLFLACHQLRRMPRVGWNSCTA